MTATEIKSYRWASGVTKGRAYRSVYELLRLDAPEVTVEALFAELIAIRGVHRVEIKRSGIGSAYRSVTVNGTDRGQHGAANKIMLSGLREVDSNADHDHARCIADAAKQGVPANWAHMVETYLSM